MSFCLAPGKFGLKFLKRAVRSPPPPVVVKFSLGPKAGGPYAVTWILISVLDQPEALEPFRRAFFSAHLIVRSPELKGCRPVNTLR